MRKIIFLIACLFCTLSCKNTTADSSDTPETLLAKEKRTQAQPTKYQGDEFDVLITSDKKDTRTYPEEVQNLSPKYEITNIVLFQRLQLYDGDLLYIPNFEIKKVIKENTGKLSFILSAKIITWNYIKFSDMQLVQIKLNNDFTKSFDCKVHYLPAPDGLGDSFHTINCTSEMSIKDIHTMRLHSGDANVLIKTAKNNFNFVLPKVFFTYLNEI
ncbi:MAG: hypothetical protein ACTTJ6_05745 [Treponema sp.]